MNGRPRPADRRGSPRRSSERAAPRRGAPPAGRTGLPPNRRVVPEAAPVTIRRRLRALRDAFAVGWRRARGRLAVLARIAIVLGGGAGVLLGVRAVEAYVRRSDAFATSSILVRGTDRLSDADVLRAAGLAVGQNVFAVDAESAEGRLRRHAWVADARVRRRLPGAYEVEVREHKPVAVLLAGSHYLLSDEGVPFKTLEADDPVDLPVVTGVDAARLAGDGDYRDSTLLTAVALLRDYREAGLWRARPVAEIHFEPDQSVSLYVGEGTSPGEPPTYVRLGHGPLRPKLTRLKQVFERAGGPSAELAYVYLDNVRRPDRVTIRRR